MRSHELNVSVQKGMMTFRVIRKFSQEGHFQNFRNSQCELMNASVHDYLKYRIRL